MKFYIEDGRIGIAEDDYIIDFIILDEPRIFTRQGTLVTPVPGTVPLPSTGDKVLRIYGASDDTVIINTRDFFGPPRLGIVVGGKRVAELEPQLRNGKWTFTIFPTDEADDATLPFCIEHRWGVNVPYSDTLILTCDEGMLVAE